MYGTRYSGNTFCREHILTFVLYIRFYSVPEEAAISVWRQLVGADNVIVVVPELLHTVAEKL